ncbi:MULTISPECIES: hypothetical protein [Kitasatospora]|uniref:Uncharacterized protein n=1 Tax=Kitasatospora setae (strain ATCC 33774 / DSM 43861 / JCM 3304 / KCC A-0304 / NBRC 14216 / KM-6054) TaxID=452652 RepID=E4N7J0_KITSK|nr:MULTISPECIES: hypothetical protein [Kitasatospora]BAJ27171.1 hypothetical protein KSE_13420 [Kitasatospora setae KM-6054]
MSVSLYYHARRPVPLTAAEGAAVERIATAHRAAFPYPDEEGLYLYGDAGGEPDDLLAGSTKLPADPERALPVIAHLLGAVTELRRALPGAVWHVHLDDLDVPWDERDGYGYGF